MYVNINVVYKTRGVYNKPQDVGALIVMLRQGVLNLLME